MSKPTVTHTKAPLHIDAAVLVTDLRELIHSARQRVATVANAEQTLLYWQMGNHVATPPQTKGDSLPGLSPGFT